MRWLIGRALPGGRRCARSIALALLGALEFYIVVVMLFLVFSSGSFVDLHVSKPSSLTIVFTSCCAALTLQPVTAICKTLGSGFSVENLYVFIERRECFFNSYIVHVSHHDEVCVCFPHCGARSSTRDCTISWRCKRAPDAMSSPYL